MNSFAMHLQSATAYERIDGVASFTGRDASGSFGILAGHSRAMTLLSFGLARFRTEEDSDWQYLAVPGGVLYFTGNELYVSCRSYVRGADYESVREALQKQLLAEERELHEIKQSMRRLEEQMFKRLLEITRRGAA